MSNDMSVLTDKPVLVSGATGYVAGWLIADLLELGCTVHACVRNPDDSDKLRYLNALAEKSKGTIKYFKSDLLEVGSYDEAMQGCGIVFHTASPFFLEVEDAKRDLLDPAVKGTENILSSVNAAESVTRVVLTSSVAAIYSDNVDCLDKPNQTLTEEHWNTHSSLAYNPYQYSKTAAEQRAWEMVEKQDRWDMTVINPSLVLGPALNPQATSDSFDLLRQFGDGTMRWGVPDSGVGVVDVKDVARAHIQAAIRPQANGRYITSAENITLLGLADKLRSRFGKQYPLPKGNVPKFLVWLTAPLVGVSREFVKRNVGMSFKADNSRCTEQLGVDFQPVDKAVVAMFEQMIESGRIPGK